MGLLGRLASRVSLGTTSTMGRVNHLFEQCTCLVRSARWHLHQAVRHRYAPAGGSGDGHRSLGRKHAASYSLYEQVAVPDVWWTQQRSATWGDRARCGRSADCEFRRFVTRGRRWRIAASEELRAQRPRTLDSLRLPKFDPGQILRVPNGVWGDGLCRVLTELERPG
jgi:hypothetical protein